MRIKIRYNREDLKGVAGDHDLDSVQQDYEQRVTDLITKRFPDVKILFGASSTGQHIYVSLDPKRYEDNRQRYEREQKTIWEIDHDLAAVHRSMKTESNKES